MQRCGCPDGKYGADMEKMEKMNKKIRHTVE